MELCQRFVYHCRRQHHSQMSENLCKFIQKMSYNMLKGMRQDLYTCAGCAITEVSYPLTESRFCQGITTPGFDHSAQVYEAVVDEASAHLHASNWTWPDSESLNFCLMKAGYEHPRFTELQYVKPVLVAVSKTKPANLVIEAYEAGQRHFGENYVQELYDKGNSSDILEKCKEIKWHFIGHLQSNKINKVLSVPNLYIIETIDSEKLASALDKAWSKQNENDAKLKIMIQVNTSGEDVKSGVDPKNLITLTNYVLENCKNLHVEGLMTIGRYGYNPEDGPNPDFLCLRQCREDLCQKLNLDWRKLDLSMGMSTDYWQAIELGSTMVRVGTSIFGARTKQE